MAPRGLPIALAVLALSIAAGTARPVRGQEPHYIVGLPGESLPTARRLAAAEKLVQQQQWPEAVEEYQRILDEMGNDLVPLDLQDRRQCVPARWLCHSRLAALPPEALRLYQDRVEGQAKKQLEQARKQLQLGGDTSEGRRLLRQLVEDWYCSRYTDQALDLLGDLTFERGNFAEADHWWGLIGGPGLGFGVGGPRPAEPKPRTPSPPLDMARILSKQILARLFAGERDGLAEEVQSLRRKYGEANGRLAGRQGKYADLLEDLLRADRVSDGTGAEGRTFAGAASRSRVFPRSPAAWLSRVQGPQWHLPLDGAGGPGEKPSAKRGALPSAKARSPAFHPVVVGNQILLAGTRSVTAYDVLTGAAQLWFDVKRDLAAADPGEKNKPPSDPEARYTLTAADGRVYARLGAPALESLGGLEARPRGVRDSYLVCLELRPPPSAPQFAWHVTARRHETEADAFEGAPVIRDGNVYIALTRVTKAQTITAIACYDAATGASRWRQDVCETAELQSGAPRGRHHLLTCAGPNVVYCSHAGAIVAVDATTGHRAWAVRYPRRGVRTSHGEPSPRELAPCVYAAGRVYAAPADADHLFCLDSASGQTLWESGAAEVVHLLGVARGRLIFTTGDWQRRGIRAVDAATGHSLRDWLQPDDGSDLPSLGRGLLAGDEVFWPTRAGLRVLNLENGRQIDVDPVRWRNVVPGNLALGEDCLAVAGTEELAVYVRPGRLLSQRQQDAAARPESAAVRFHLAQAEADAGRFDEALTDFAVAECLAGPDERWQETSLRGAARQGRQALLVEEAARARRRQCWDRAADLLRRAAADEFPAPARLRAVAQLASLWSAAGQPARELAVWQSVLDDATLRGSLLAGDDQIPRRAALWAAARVEELVRRHGSTLYAEWEQRAEDLRTSARGPQTAEILERLVAQYPNAEAAGRALLQLASLREQAGEYGAAAQCYRTFLRRAEKAVERRAEALVGLARAYERQHCGEAARTAWQRLAREQGCLTLAALDPRKTVASWVTSHLQQPEFLSFEKPALPELALPLTRRWEVTLAPDRAGRAERLLSPEKDEEDALPRPDFLLLARGTSLVCRDSASGRPRWERALGHTPVWVGRHADTVLAGSPAGLHSLGLADGRPLWEWRYERLDNFRLKGARVFCLQDERRLLALDAETGRVRWSYLAPGAHVGPLPPGGRFHPHYHAGKDWVTLQTGGGQLLVLDSRTGHKRHEIATSRTPWPRPPVALAERCVCLVPDLRQVVLLDPATATELWRVPTRWPSVCAPQVVWQRGHLLLLIDGYELQRLDPPLPTSGPGLPGLELAAGLAPWQRGGLNLPFTLAALSRPQTQWQRLLGTETLDGASLALDDSAFYYVSRNILQARSLADGRRLWDAALSGPAGPWRAVRTRDWLIVFPLHSEPGHDFPVVCYDPKDGQVVQRLNFSSRGARPAVQILDRGIAVVAEGKAWGL